MNGSQGGARLRRRGPLPAWGRSGTLSRGQTFVLVVWMGGGGDEPGVSKSASEQKVDENRQRDEAGTFKTFRAPRPLWDFQLLEIISH